MNWYCVHTRPQSEPFVTAYLQDKLSLEVYFPKLRQQKTIRRVRRLVTGPLFPRYLFCRLDLAGGFNAVRYAPDVLDVVAFGGRPAVVDDVIVDELRAWAADAVDIITLQPGFKCGDLVEITAGPMRGLRAVITDERSADDRVSVLLGILDCGAHMRVSRSQLQLVA